MCPFGARSSESSNMMFHSLPVAALLFFSKFALINAAASGQTARLGHNLVSQSLSTDVSPSPVRPSFPISVVPS